MGVEVAEMEWRVSVVVAKREMREGRSGVEGEVSGREERRSAEGGDWCDLRCCRLNMKGCHARHLRCDIPVSGRVFWWCGGRSECTHGRLQRIHRDANKHGTTPHPTSLFG